VEEEEREGVVWRRRRRYKYILTQNFRDFRPFYSLIVLGSKIFFAAVIFLYK